jgi:hypothetical protein
MPTNSSDTNRRTILIALIAVVVVGAVVAFALFQTSPAPPSGSRGTAAGAPSPAPTQAAPFAPPTAPLPHAEMATEPKTETQIPAWENQIDGVLRSNVNEAQTAQILINMLPTLPEDGQIEAANHISNLLPDSNYNQVKPTLLNPNAPESVLSVFFTDLMNRDDNTKLHTFLDLAKVPNHPFHEEALSDLQIYVGEDYGNDWAKWSAAVEQYLKNASAAAQ